MKILLVEDTPELRELIGIQLRKLGEVVETTCAPEAVSALYKDRFDIIVSDFNMPGGNGDQVLEAKNRLGLSTPFVYFSSQGDLQPGPGIAAIFDKYQLRELVQFVRLHKRSVQ